MIKERMLRLLFELIKNSKRSDREIAKILGVSQPTITRMRQRLEKKAIVEYTIIPDWQELGFEIMAFTFIRMARRPELIEKARQWATKNPSIVSARWGEGMGMDGALITFHKNFSGFSEFITSLKTYWTEDLRDIESFLMTTASEAMIKPFSFKYLGKEEKEEN